MGIRSIDLFAIVGWIPSDELPSIGPYLRVKYAQLPAEAVQEIKAVARKYGIDTNGVQTPKQEEQ